MIRAQSGTVAVMALAAMLATTSDAQQAQPAAPGQEPPKATPGTVERRLDPKAIELLKAMSARLAAARTMSFTAVSSYESPSRIGAPLIYMTLSEVTLQRPDKLRVITPYDGPASEFYFDGKTIMAYAPAEGLVAVADAPSTIDAALKLAYESAAIYFPFTDVIVADPYKDIADGLVLAFYIGQSRVVGGTTTDMLAVANEQVFGQLWIGAEDKLPRLFRALYAGDAARLRQEVAFSNWRLDGKVPAESFKSAQVASAKRIPFRRPDPPATPPAGVAEKAQPPASK